MKDSRKVAQFFRLLPEGSMSQIEAFCIESLGKEYRKFDTKEEIQSVFENPDLKEEDQLALRDYSGYNYIHLNHAITNRWNYMEDGNIAKKQEFLEGAKQLESIIETNSQPTCNFKTYRAVPLSYFKDYGIETLEDLKDLQEKFLLEEGFVSTSLLEKNCFFQKPNTMGINYNVKIEYLVDETFKDGLYLGNTFLSNHQEENEFLMNHYQISKVVSCDIDASFEFASLKAVVIPKAIYDSYYQQKQIHGNVK